MIRSSAVLCLALLALSLAAAPSRAAPVGDLGLNPAPLPTAKPPPGKSLGSLPVLPDPLSRPGPKPPGWQGPSAAVPSSPLVSVPSSRQASGPGEEGANSLSSIQKVLWATSGVIVRNEPSPRAKRVGSIDPGKRVEVIGKTADGEWYKIARKGKDPGYVAANLLAEEAPERERQRERPREPAAAEPTPPPPTTRTEAAIPVPQSNGGVDVMPDGQGRCPSGMTKLALTDGTPVCIKM